MSVRHQSTVNFTSFYPRSLFGRSLVTHLLSPTIQMSSPSRGYDELLLSALSGGSVECTRHYLEWICEFFEDADHCDMLLSLPTCAIIGDRSPHVITGSMIAISDGVDNSDSDGGGSGGSSATGTSADLRHGANALHIAARDDGLMMLMLQVCKSPRFSL